MTTLVHTGESELLQISRSTK